MAFNLPGSTRKAHLRQGSSDLYVYEQIFLAQEYRMSHWPQYAAVQAAYQAILAEGRKPLIVDCGANIGLSTLWFREAFPQAEIVAVEPDAGNFALLQKNLEGLPGIVAIQAGVWDRPASLAITNEDARAWEFQLAETEDPNAIAAVTLPDILALDPKYRPLIVKIDIEGAEVELFRSNSEWADITPLLIIELHDWLSPWHATGCSFFTAACRRARDFRFRGENIFAFLNPEDALGVTSR